ncbi:putative protein phosphatase 2C 60 [Camellia lanceoleosa]|uniref:Uncharacterized protein n=1 Tax=Camellia lanceoleosa TaxID=1840588 RepID=A0ACC0HBU1_9ERIC|nr:putative protein phosphatase 2C 60 [Camellia lanceoleosa]
MLAAQTIELRVNDNDIVVAGGMESMSNAPKYLAETRKGSQLGHDTIIDGMLKDRLWDVYNDFGMGVCADVCADKYTITREEQDAYAIICNDLLEMILNHYVYLKKVIVPTDLARKKGDPTLISMGQLLEAHCVAIIWNNQLFVANAGDSRCVISRKGQAYNLSRDHKPDLEAEKDRILKAGGIVQYGRANGSLNLARAIGDMELKQNKSLPTEKQIVTANPNVNTVELCDDDEFLVIACDGIYSLYLQDTKENETETETEAGLECLHQSAKKELQVYLNVDGPLKDSNESSTQN